MSVCLTFCLERVVLIVCDECDGPAYAEGSLTVSAEVVSIFKVALPTYNFIH